MNVHLVDIIIPELNREVVHKIKALEINGRARALQDLVNLAEKHPQDYRKLLITLELVASNYRVLNKTKVRPGIGKGLEGIFEMKGGQARLFFFYDEGTTDIIVCTNMYWKAHSSPKLQNKAFQIAAEMRKIYFQVMNGKYIRKELVMSSIDKENLPAIVGEALEDVEDTDVLLDKLKSHHTDLNLSSDPEFIAEYLKTMFVEDIWRVMDEQGISRAELARRLGKSRQYVGRVLHESANFTLESIAELACALGMQVVLRLHDPSEKVTFQPNPMAKKPPEHEADKEQEAQSPISPPKRSKAV